MTTACSAFSAKGRTWTYSDLPRSSGLLKKELKWKQVGSRRSKISSNSSQLAPIICGSPRHARSKSPKPKLSLTASSLRWSKSAANQRLRLKNLLLHEKALSDSKHFTNHNVKPSLHN